MIDWSTSRSDHVKGSYADIALLMHASYKSFVASPFAINVASLRCIKLVPRANSIKVPVAFYALRRLQTAATTLMSSSLPMLQSVMSCALGSSVKITSFHS